MSLFDDFYDNKTDSFATPSLEQNIKHPYNLNMVMNCIKTLAKEPGLTLNSACRVYLNNHQSNTFEAKRFIQEIALHSDLSEINWQKLTDGKPFLIFLNKATLFSETLDTVSRFFLGDFCKRFEPDGVRLEHHVIIGHYDETAFGVHIDDPVDRVFHFNLGPCEKEMLLWPRHTFMERYPHDRARPLSTVNIESSTRYPMLPGSCFFLPADYYHVGCSPSGVSIVIAIAFSRLSAELQFDIVINEIKRTILSIGDITPYWSRFDSYISLTEQEKVMMVFNQRSFETLLKHARARLQSNAYFIEVPPLFPPPYFGCEPIDVLISPITPPCVVEEGDMLHVYARGQHIILSSSAAIHWMKTLLEIGSYRMQGDEILAGIHKGDQTMLAAGWLLSTRSCTASPCVMSGDIK